MGLLPERTSTFSHDHSTILSHHTQQGMQAASLLAPPLLILSAIRARHFSPTVFLRNYGIATFLGGSAAGAALGYARLQVKDKKVGPLAVAIRSDRAARQLDDSAIIGGVLGALGTTTVFLKRVKLPWTLAGGAALGVAGGVITQFAKNYSATGETGVEHAVNEAKDVVKE